MSDTFHVVAAPYLGGEPTYAHFPAGMTIAQALGEDAAHSIRVRVGGVEVPRELWPKVKPRAGVPVVATVEMQGGNGGKLLRTVALIALVVVANVYGAALGGALGLTGATAAAVGTAAITIVGSLAINALIPPPSPKLGGQQDPFNQLANLTGTSNQANPYGVIPCVVGTCRFFPPHAALPYTEVSGDDQYLRMLLDLGYGDLDISDIRIGETAIESYDDVEVEISSNPTIFSQDIFEATVGTALIASGDTDTRTTQTATTEISLDVVFAQGLFGVDSKGRTVTGYTSFTVEYRPTGAGSWTNVIGVTGLTLTGGLTVEAGLLKLNSAAKKTLRTGVRWKVASGQYDVRVTRGASSWPDAAAGATAGDAAWTVLRSVSPQLPSTTGTLKLAVRIKATNQLQGVVQNLSVLAAQKIPTYNPATGTWSANAASGNPAWIYAWLFTRCPAVMRRLPDARLDLAGIYDWAAECTSKGYAIGFVMDSARALGDILRDVLAAGRASFGMRNGKYGAVRDVAQTVPVQMFTPANSSGFSYARVFSDLPHALRVTFTNPEASWQQDVVTVYADGYSAGTATRFESLDLRMVIDPNAAWRLGRYYLAVIYKRPTTYAFTADVEHIVCERGDLIHVGHDIIGWGMAYGRVRSVTGARVIIDGPLDLDLTKTYAIRVRGLDGQTEGSVDPSVTWDTSYVTFDRTTLGGPTVVFDIDPSITVAAGDLYVLGEVNKVTTPLVVKSIQPGNDLSAQITAVDYSADIISADSGTPPAFVSEITGTGWCAPPDPPVLTIRAGNSEPDNAGILQPQPGLSAGPSAGIYRLPTFGSRVSANYVSGAAA